MVNSVEEITRCVTRRVPSTENEKSTWDSIYNKTTFWCHSVSIVVPHENRNIYTASLLFHDALKTGEFAKTIMNNCHSKPAAD